MKRLFDLIVSSIALLLLSPVLIAVSIAIWLQDFHSPFYVAPRAARNGGAFRMVKFRSMTVGADRTGVDSTAASDSRITPIGQFIRAYKLDELMQLWNVVTGSMSLVGPRPQVLREVNLYTNIERQLLKVRPGITDLSSIVFADEGEILKDAEDADLTYHQLIRPWKSRLGLLYVQHASPLLDIKLIALTALALISRDHALSGIQRVLKTLGADEQTRHAAMRATPLTPFPPPGATDVVTHR